jgi:hypothetical protein
MRFIILKNFKFFASNKPVMKKEKSKKEKSKKKEGDKLSHQSQPPPEEKPFDFGGLPQRDLKKNLGCG